MTKAPCRFHERIWDYLMAGWIATFLAAEIPALIHECHPTFSSVLARRHAGPLVFAAGCALAVHVVRYKISPEE